MKRIWITALEKDEAGVQRLIAGAKAYGLGAAGHFWTDDLARMAWAGAREELGHADTGAWVILATPAALASVPIRTGLALLALDLQSRKGGDFPIFLLGAGAQELPTPLRGAERHAPDAPALAVKLVAAVNRPRSGGVQAYRLSLHPAQGLGLWVEVGPAPGDTWHGVLFGTSEGTIDAHGVGPQGQLPVRSTLEYPMKELRLDLGGTPHTAWAVRNTLDAGQSYFLRVQGLGGSMVFGLLPEDDVAELFRIQLS